jgi:hypothetical protein
VKVHITDADTYDLTGRVLQGETGEGEVAHVRKSGPRGGYR